MAGVKKSSIVTNGHQGTPLPGEKALLKRRSAAPGRELRQAFCPVCTTAHGKKIVRVPMAQGGDMNARVNFWEYITQHEEELGYDKPPFGVIQVVGLGKGHSMPKDRVRHFGPEDDPDGFFPLIRDRLLLVLRRWYESGWLTDAEIKTALSSSRKI